MAQKKYLDLDGLKYFWANKVKKLVPTFDIKEFFKTKTYVELCRSKYSYTDGSSFGAITIDGVLGGWLGNEIGYTNILIPLRIGANPTVTHAGRTIKYSVCDIIAVHDDAGKTHVYLEMNGYTTCSLSMKGTPEQWEETDHTPFTTTPHGDEFFRLSRVEESIFDRVYPVGSIYISTSSTNPRSYFGVGTWEEIQGKFLLGHSSSHPAGSTGGEASHVLSLNEMPVHNHRNRKLPDGSETYSWGWGNQHRTDVYADTKVYAGTPSGNNPVTQQGSTHSTDNAGGGLPHNNMPPYLTVYIWKRIA